MNYIIVKHLREKTDYETDLMLLDYNHPLFDHPAWEDVPLKISQDLIKDNLAQTLKIRDDHIEKYKWKMPTWVKEQPIKYSIYDKFFTKYIDKFHTNKKQINHYVKYLKKYDFVFTDGFGAISAYLAKVPYVIRPYGTDIDVLPFQDNFIGTMIRKTYKNCYAITGQQQMNNLYKIEGTKGKLLPIGVVIDTEKLKPQKSKHEKISFFIASRLDFDIKGSDKAIKAFKKIIKSYDVHLFCIGYGKDIKKSQELIKKLNIVKNVTFYDFVASKPVLNDLLNRHDAVICNLNIGSFGTTELEALACETPVIAYTKPFSEFEENAPFLNANTEEQIYHKMIDICERKNIPQNMRSFVKEYYGFKKFLKYFIQIVQ